MLVSFHAVGMKTLKLIWLLLVVTGLGCAREQPPVKVADNDWVNTKSGLAYRAITKGTGPNATAGQRVTIHETLTLPDGKVIFSSRAKNQPVTFQLGANQV